MTCAFRGFQAFDGSQRFYKRWGVFDLDCCFLPDGRKHSPGISDPDDGYYILEKVSPCGCCPTNNCVVVESTRYYAAHGFAVGTIVRCPERPRSVPNLVFNSATKRSLGVDNSCCNPDGSKIYAELTDEIDCGNPLP